jgi:hypothetical protein
MGPDPVTFLLRSDGGSAVCRPVSSPLKVLGCDVFPIAANVQEGVGEAIPRITPTVEVSKRLVSKSDSAIANATHESNPVMRI